MDQEAFERYHQAHREEMLKKLRKAMKSGVDPKELAKFPNEWVALITRKGGEYETVILDHDKNLRNLSDRLKKSDPKIKAEISFRFIPNP